MKMRCKKARKNISLAMDSRLQPAGLEQLQTHLHDCASCRNWQHEQSSIRELFSTREALEPNPGFYKKLQMKIDVSPLAARFDFLTPAGFRPLVLRAAMLLILISAAWGGFSLGDRLDTPAADTPAMIFNRTMNLNAYADMPSDSFGAVYDRLLQGDLK
jgi:predicted anti-sigma-YlaC factor YlaD